MLLTPGKINIIGDIGVDFSIVLLYYYKNNKLIRMKYVINPAGTEAKLDNALVGFIRFGVEF